MSRSQRERIRVRLEAKAESLEGRLLNYLNSDPVLYTPWAMETQLDEVELSRLARSAIEALQLRIFQIQQRYLLGNSPATLMPGASQSTPEDSNSTGRSQKNRQRPLTIDEMRRRINPAELDDDF